MTPGTEEMLVKFLKPTMKDQSELITERAAIMEFSGGMERERAELLAVEGQKCVECGGSDFVAEPDGTIECLCRAGHPIRGRLIR